MVIICWNIGCGPQSKRWFENSTPREKKCGADPLSFWILPKESHTNKKSVWTNRQPTSTGHREGYLPVVIPKEERNSSNLSQIHSPKQTHCCSSDQSQERTKRRCTISIKIAWSIHTFSSLCQSPCSTTAPVSSQRDSAAESRTAKFCNKPPIRPLPFLRKQIVENIQSFLARDDAAIARKTEKLSPLVDFRIRVRISNYYHKTKISGFH